MRLFKNHLELFFIVLFIAIIMPAFYLKNCFDPVLIPRTFALSILVFVMLLFFGFKNYNAYQYQIHKSFLIPFLLIIGYFLISFMSAFFAINRIESFAEISKIGIIILFFVYLSLIISFDFEKMEWLIRALIISAAFYMFIGIYQLLFKVDLTDIKEKESYLAYYYTKALLVVKSSLANKNLFSSATFLSLPFLLYGAIYLRKWERVISSVLLVIALFFVGILVSKAVWVALGAALVFGLVFLIYFTIRKVGFSGIPLVYKISFFTVLLTLVVFSTFVYTSENKFAVIVKEKVEQLIDFENFKEENIINTERTYSSQQRVLAYYRSFDMFKENPVLGVGPGNWRINLPKYGLYGFGGDIEQGNRNFMRAHSDYLWVLCESGIFGLLLYFGLFVYCIFIGVRNFFREKEPNKKYLNLFLATGLFGFFILSSFDFPKERITHNVFVFSMFAIILNLNTQEKGLSIPRNLAYALFGISFLFNVYAFIYQKNRLESEIVVTDVERAWRMRNHQLVLREARGVNEAFYSVNPLTLPVEYYKGIAYSFNNRPKLARNSLAKAYSQHPYQIMVINNYATILNMTGKTKEAKELYKKAVRISPRSMDSNANLASMLYNEKKFDEAYELMLNIKYAPQNKRYKEVLIPVLKQKLAEEYKRSKDPKIREYVVQIIQDDKKLLNFQRQVMLKNNNFVKVLKELSNK